MYLFKIMKLVKDERITMKKNIFLFIFVAIFGLIGCNNDNTNNKKIDNITYYLAELSNANEILKEDDIKTLGLNYELVISTKDNKAILSFGDNKLNLTLNEKELIDEENSDHIPYEKTNNNYIINYNGEKMVFKEK